MIRFVTGTDTGVGKTIASAVLAAAARRRGARVAYVKPVQTGLAPGARGDADFVAEAAGVEAAELLRFDEPLAPAVAAEHAGVPIDVGDLAAAIRDRAARVDVLYVEGAGGLLVPLTATETMADLAEAIGADLVVVTRPTLGTLNHTALTLEAAAGRGLAVAMLVISGWPSRPGVVEETNLGRLRAMTSDLVVIGRIRGVSVDDGRTEPLRKAIERGRATLDL